MMLRRMRSGCIECKENGSTNILNPFGPDLSAVSMNDPSGGRQSDGVFGQL